MSAEPIDILQPLLTFLSIYLLIMPFAVRGNAEIEGKSYGYIITIFGYVFSAIFTIVYMATVVLEQEFVPFLGGGLLFLFLSLGGYGMFISRHSEALPKVEV